MLSRVFLIVSSEGAGIILLSFSKALSFTSYLISSFRKLASQVSVTKEKSIVVV
jgi:hypothetical protein